MNEPILKFYDDDGYGEALTFLKTSDNHTILRKINFPNPSQVSISNQRDCTIYRGVYLDTETTGLSHKDSEVIQICMLPFIYAHNSLTNDYTIIGVYPPYVGFKEPSGLLSQEIIDLTGITMDMLKGQKLDIIRIDAILEKADFVIAHNADFDRPFTHDISAKFTETKWACSMSNVPWRELGFESLKLTHLAADLGFYFAAHQADKDCLAGLAILAQVDESGESYFQKMIKIAEKDSITIRAEYAPFETKDILKQRGYSWKDGSDGDGKGWEIVIAIDNAENERVWLTAEVYKGKPKFSEKSKNAITRFATN
ncbi:MAG: DNA polymerase-3 subunit epsilon [Arenicella sp.]|jgi:DNA polymerase-3 subunit epsilon